MAEEQEAPIVSFYHFKLSTLVLISIKNEFFRENFPLVQVKISKRQGMRFLGKENLFYGGGVRREIRNFLKSLTL